MRKSPRIRRLESDTTLSLTHELEHSLKQLQQSREGHGNGEDSEEDLLLMIGHCMRGLALLGRSKEVENVFARVAIM